MYYAIKVRNVLGYFARQSIEMLLVGHIKFNDWCRLRKPASNARGQTKRATKGLLKLKRGRLIFVGSVVGSVGAAGQVNYSASKSGLVGMARSFARELGSRGITANVIAPGFVETDMTSSLDEKRRSDIAAQVPLGRFCSAEEIAEVVSFIASSKASYITGAIIPVDGGLGMGH